MKRRSLIDSLSQIRRSMTFGEADKKRSAFGKKSGVPGSAVDRPLLDISFSSDDIKRHSYHGSSSYDHSTRESSIDTEVVGLINKIYSCIMNLLLQRDFSPSAFNTFEPF